MSQSSGLRHSNTLTTPQAKWSDQARENLLFTPSVAISQNTRTPMNVRFELDPQSATLPSRVSTFPSSTNYPTSCPSTSFSSYPMEQVPPTPSLFNGLTNGYGIGPRGGTTNVTNGILPGNTTSSSSASLFSITGGGPPSRSDPFSSPPPTHSLGGMTTFPSDLQPPITSLSTPMTYHASYDRGGQLSRSEPPPLLSGRSPFLLTGQPIPPSSSTCFSRSSFSLSQALPPPQHIDGYGGNSFRSLSLQPNLPVVPSVPRPFPSSDPFGSSETSSTPSSEHALKRWVTVFGFPPDLSIHILKLFSEYGAIEEHRIPPVASNFIYIKFASELQAKRALSNNGKIVNGSLIIGVLECKEKTVLSKSDTSNLCLGAMTAKRDNSASNPSLPQEPPRKRLRSDTDWWSKIASLFSG